MDAWCMHLLFTEVSSQLYYLHVNMLKTPEPIATEEISSS